MGCFRALILFNEMPNPTPLELFLTYEYSWELHQEIEEALRAVNPPPVRRIETNNWVPTIDFTRRVVKIEDIVFEGSPQEITIAEFKEALDKRRASGLKRGEWGRE